MYFVITILSLLILFYIINIFDTSFMYINLIERELLKDNNVKNINKIEYFLNNIIKLKITSNVISIFTIAKLTYLLFKLYNSIIIFLIMLILLILIQLISKVNAKKNIYNSLLITIDIIIFLHYLIFPIIMLLKILYDILNKIFNNGLNLDDVIVTEEDIKSIIDSKKIKDVEVEEKEMIHSIFSFTDTTVKEIMTPRISVVAFNKDQKLNDVWPEIIECEFSRIPIYNDGIDDIIGILNTKDLLRYTRDEDKNINLSYFVKEVAYVPETKTLGDMLEYFRKEQQHMAIIIDEYGGTLGIITIEDLLEEIVGEIRDEYDIEEENFKEISRNVYILLGETLVEEINDEYDINIPESEEYDTISGYIQYSLGKVAEINDKVVNKKYIIQVLEIDNKKIVKVKLIVK